MPSIMENQSIYEEQNCKGVIENGKYVRYTAEQIEALERAYNECSKPSTGRRLQLIRENPVLSNIEPKQIKVWFQNRRCRDKQRKETTRLLAWNGKFTAMNQLLLEENERLRKQATQLDCENQYLRQQLQLLEAHSKSSKSSAQMTLNETSSDSVITSGQRQHGTFECLNTSRLFSLAEEALAEFLAKATGTAMDWIQIPGMKPGPDSIGLVAIAHARGGVAVQAWGVMGLEPFKVADALHDKACWLRDCRQMDVLATFHSPNGHRVELLNTQIYAPTTLVSPRSFHTLRYTSSLDDGSLVICEKSLSASQSRITMPQLANFVVAEVLSSGYLIRPCEGRGSLIIMVDHRDLKASAVPDILRPLYESSTFFAQKMTVEASGHLQARIQPETTAISKKVQHPYDVCSQSQRLCRGFNDAINSLADDGWIPLSKDGPSDFCLSVKSFADATQMGDKIPSSNDFSSEAGILSIKTTLLLQDVSPSALVRLLREHRTEWMDYDLCFNHKTSCFQGTDVGSHGSFRQVFLPLVQYPELDESLEAIKLESIGEETSFKHNEGFILQLCNGINEVASSGWAQLIFAPVDSTFTSDNPLLPSGFRIITISNYKDQCNLSRTLDLTSNLEGGSQGCQIHVSREPDSYCHSSVLTLAFQFKFDFQRQEFITVKAQNYCKKVTEFIKKAAAVIMPACESSQKRIKSSTWSLVYEVISKYRKWFCTDLFKIEGTGTPPHDDLFKIFWNHNDAIISYVIKNIPEYLLANQAGLEMLETTASSLQGLAWLRTISENDQQSAYKDLLQVLQQGYSYLPAGIRISSTGRTVAYERAIAWNVSSSCNDGSCVVAIMFINWSFLN